MLILKMGLLLKKRVNAKYPKFSEALPQTPLRAFRAAPKPPCFKAQKFAIWAVRSGSHPAKILKTILIHTYSYLLLIFVLISPFTD